jgi:hypothetical protein
MKKNNSNIYIILYIVLAIILICFIYKYTVGENFSIFNEPVTRKDAYSILQLSPGSTEEEIKKSWKKMNLMYHPDRNPGMPVEGEFGVKDQRDILYINKSKDILLSSSFVDDKEQEIEKEIYIDDINLTSIMKTLTDPYGFKINDIGELTTIYIKLRDIYQKVNSMGDNELIRYYENIYDLVRGVLFLVSLLDKNKTLSNEIFPIDYGLDMKKCNSYKPIDKNIFNDIDFINVRYVHKDKKCLDRKYYIGDCLLYNCKYRAHSIVLNKSRLTSQSGPILIKKLKETGYSIE